MHVLLTRNLEDSKDLIQKFKLDNTEKNLWCTFSEDQVDLNFKNPEVLMDFLEILIHCLNNGINIFRLDAVGFIWKEKYNRN